MSQGVSSGFCHQKKHVLLGNGNTEVVQLVIYPLVLPWREQAKRRQWAVVGQVLMRTQHPGHGHRADQHRKMHSKKKKSFSKVSASVA